MEPQSAMNPKDENLDEPQVVPWAEHDDFDGEMTILGNRQGLLAIRSAIDAALDKQEARIEEPEVKFVKVLLMNQARPVEKPFPAGKWLIAGCLLLAAAAILIFLFGLVEIVRNLL